MCGYTDTQKAITTYKKVIDIYTRLNKFVEAATIWKKIIELMVQPNILSVTDDVLEEAIMLVV